MATIRSAVACVVVSALALCAAPALAGGSRVLVLSSSNATLDSQVVSALQSMGHTATLGPTFTDFTGTFDLSNFDVVYFQANANWFFADMADAAQTSLVNFVNGGGGLLTSEWTIWLVSGSFRFQILDQVFPAQSSANYDFPTTATFTRVTPDPVINASLPDSFTIPLTSFSGTETEVLPRPGATSFYSTTTFPPAGMGLIGAPAGSGRVLSMSICAGADSWNDANFSRLFNNCISWLAGGAPPCRADFNADGDVTSQDFFDFLTAFFTEAPSADFNADGNINSQDFFDFLAAFFVGC